MKIPEIVEAMSHIDEDLIAEAVEIKKNRGWVKWITVAACLCLMAVGAWIWKEYTPAAEQDSDMTAEDIDAAKSSIEVTEDGITIPKLEVSLSQEDNATACMIGFFIYQGRVYVYYDRIYEDVDIIDEHLGTATGLIDVWTPIDGYVDYAGSVRGEFYSIKGYDPSFMLCMKESNDATVIYICNTGITLQYGSDLYEDRLLLADNYVGVQYETHDSWYYSKDERYALDVENEVISDFIEQLNTAEFMWCKDVPLETEAEISEMQEYLLYFIMDNGTSFYLRLCEGGYILFDGVMDACVKIPEETYDALTEVLSEQEGTPVDYDSGYPIATAEECMSDPELGGYVPPYVPEGFELSDTDISDIYYYLDTETGDAIGTKEIQVYYSSSERKYVYYGITVTWADEYGENGWAGPMIDASELTLEAIEEYMEYEYSEDGELLPDENRIDVGIWYGDVSVVIGGSGLDAETVLAILDSVG